MSADNFWLIRRAPAGKFVALMGFASDDAEPVVLPVRDYPLFDTPEAALASVADDFAEYGHDIHGECYAPADEGHEAPARARLLWEESKADLVQLAESNPAEALASAFELGFELARS